MNNISYNPTICSVNHFYNTQLLSQNHQIFPLSNEISTETIFGLFLTFIVAGLSSLAGIAGGAPHLAVLMFFYNYSPKHSTIVIFSCLLGTTLGNVLSQMRQKINNQPIIQYQYAFISIPILFIGSMVGILINQIFPTILITAYIMYWVAKSIKDIYKKFITAYTKQTEENLNISSQKSKKYNQTSFNPLQYPKYRYIFKNLLFLFGLFIIIQLVKGTQKFDSIIGVQRCSIMYWILYMVLFLTMIVFSYHNLNVLKQWQIQPESNSYQIKPIQKNKVDQNITYITKMSFLGGIFSGLGRGGGFFLIPVYKYLGCNSIQAAATCSFTVFSSSLLNVIQGVMLGIIGLQDFLVLFTVSILGSYIFSSFIPKYLQRINRVSLVQGSLLVIISLSLINIPISLFLKYQRNGYDSNLLFGFGKFC